MADTSGLALNISAVERETGLSKDVLRMWERRYGFPDPLRDDNGERQYRARAGRQAARDQAADGYRHAAGQADAPHARRAQRARRYARRTAPRRRRAARSSATSSRCCKGHDAPALQHALANLLMRQGLQRFVLETLVPLNRAVGDAWMRGELQVFEEHLYTEQMQVALRTAINAFPRQTGAPRVLLTTFPGEQHGLGLLMVEALLVPEGAQCISLGTQTPLEDIRRAALAHKVAYRRAVVLGGVSAAAGQRRPGDAAAARGRADGALGRRRNDAARAQVAARRTPDRRSLRSRAGAEGLAHRIGISAPRHCGEAGRLAFVRYHRTR